MAQLVPISILYEVPWPISSFPDGSRTSRAPAIAPCFVVLRAVSHRALLLANTTTTLVRAFPLPRRLTSAPDLACQTPWTVFSVPNGDPLGSHRRLSRPPDSGGQVCDPCPTVASRPAARYGFELPHFFRMMFHRNTHWSDTHSPSDAFRYSVPEGYRRVSQTEHPVDHSCGWRCPLLALP